MIIVSSGVGSKPAPSGDPITVRDAATGRMPQHEAGDFILCVGRAAGFTPEMVPGWTLIMDHGFANVALRFVYKIAESNSDGGAFTNTYDLVAWSLVNAKGVGNIGKISATYPAEVQGEILSIGLQNPNGTSFVLAGSTVSDGLLDSPLWNQPGIEMSNNIMFTLKDTNVAATPHVAQPFQRFGYQSFVMEIKNTPGVATNVGAYTMPPPPPPVVPDPTPVVPDPNDPRFNPAFGG